MHICYRLARITPSAPKTNNRVIALILCFVASFPAAYAMNVVPNPNPRVPMAAVLQGIDQDVDRVGVVAVADDHRFELSLTPDEIRLGGYPLVGFRPNRNYELTVTLYQGGQRIGDQGGFRFKSPPLPVDSREWPQIDYRENPNLTKEPGYIFASVRRNTMTRPFKMTAAQRRFTEAWGLIVAFDGDGEVVWYYQAPVRTAGIDRLQNGNLFFHTAYFQSIEIDMLGNTVREFQPEFNPRHQVQSDGAVLIKGIQTLHHQPHQLPNGNFLAFSSNEREIENYYTSEFDRNAPRKTQMVNGDTVIEFTAQGEIVWSWNAFDHLPVDRIGYNLTDPYWWVRGFPGNLDWTHGNGISYDESDDSIIIYLKHQDAAFKISRESKEIVWIFGEPTDWPDHLMPKLLNREGNFRWPYHAHNPRMTKRGTFVLYENGQWGARPFTGVEPVKTNDAFSRAVEYLIDEKAMVVREVWVSHRQQSEDTCYAPGMGDVSLLEKTEHLLVFDPVCFDQKTYPMTENQRDLSLRHNSELNHHARIREYSHDAPPSVVREWVIRDSYEVVNWQVYGGFLSTTLYTKAPTH